MPGFRTHRNCETINTCFKLLRCGIICYTATDNFLVIYFCDFSSTGHRVWSDPLLLVPALHSLVGDAGTSPPRLALPPELREGQEHGRTARRLRILPALTARKLLPRTLRKSKHPMQVRCQHECGLEHRGTVKPLQKARDAGPGYRLALKAKPEDKKPRAQGPKDLQGLLDEKSAGSRHL